MQGPLQINTGLCTHASEPCKLNRRRAHMHALLHMNTRRCISANGFANKHGALHLCIRSMQVCRTACKFAESSANLQSGVQICQGRCSCARAGFHKHFVFVSKAICKLLILRTGKKAAPATNSATQPLRRTGPGPERLRLSSSGVARQGHETFPARHASVL